MYFLHRFHIVILNRLPESAEGLIFCLYDYNFLTLFFYRLNPIKQLNSSTQKLSGIFT